MESVLRQVRRWIATAAVIAFGIMVPGKSISFYLSRKNGSEYVQASSYYDLNELSGIQLFWGLAGDIVLGAIAILVPLLAMFCTVGIMLEEHGKLKK